MPITVKFFARLREELNIDETQINVTAELTALQAWQQITGLATLPPKILIAVNQEYAKATETLNDGDELAFFPPVTGG